MFTVKTARHYRADPGSRFRWTTPVPATPWSGPAIGDGPRIDRGVHVRTFTPARGGGAVRTEKSWTGARIEADPATAVKYLDRRPAGLETAAEAAC